MACCGHESQRLVSRREDRTMNGFGWDANPWVVAITFKVHQINVDTLIARREGASAA